MTKKKDVKTATGYGSFQPYVHQQYSLDHDRINPIVFDCSSPGTGKTAVRLWAFRVRRKAGGGAALVIAPRSLLRAAWLNDIGRFTPDLAAVVADASNRESAFNSRADIYLTNSDATKWLAERPGNFFDRFSELIVDESTAFKHHTSQRSRALAKIARHFERRILMTGTPTSNSITDIWHQMFILDGGARLGRSFFAFRNAVCTPVQVGRIAQAVKWMDKPGATENVYAQISDIVVRHKFEDCISIPDNFKYNVDFTLSKKHQKIYDDLAATAVLSLKAGNISAINAAALTTKLLQVASGAVYDGSGGYVKVDSDRYELILDLVQQRQHPLVFFMWDHQKELLVAEATKRGLSFCVYDGNTSNDDRNQFVKNYQAGMYDVMFAHPKTASYGLTLTTGTSTIWASPTYDLEHYIQGSQRQHRLGQTKKTETIVVIAKGTLDERAYARMESKDHRMTELLDMLQSIPTPAKTTP